MSGKCRKVRTKPQMLSYNNDYDLFCVYSILASIRIFVSTLEKKRKINKSTIFIE